MKIKPDKILFMFCLVLGSFVQNIVFANDQARIHETDVIDISDVRVEFNVRVLGLARINGSFERLYGIMMNNRNGDPDTVSMRIDVNSINTSDIERDNYLLGPAFFEADRYPHITFEGSCKMQAADGNMKLTGELQLRGRSRQITFEIEPVNTKDEATGYRAIATIKRSEFGLLSLKHIISDEIEIIVQM